MQYGEFDQVVYDQFEALRIFGFVNMMDRLMIEQLARFLDFDELAEVASDRKRYSRLLLQFGAWKREPGHLSVCFRSQNIGRNHSDSER
jgi:hypothetical protein